MASYADSPYGAISALDARTDDASTHALVDWFEHTDPAVRLEAARALARRGVPAVLRPRLIAALVDGRHAHPDHLSGWPLQVAARALFEGPAADAFQVAVPLLDPAAIAGDHGRARAAAIVGVLEDVLVAAHAGRAATPDPRWRDRVAALAGDDEIGFVATLALDGFRCLAGEPWVPPLLTVELGEGDEPPFPFAFAGFMLDAMSTDTGAVADALRAAPIPPPPGLVMYFHQYAGLACLHATLIGYGVAVPTGTTARAALDDAAAASYGDRGEAMSAAERADWGPRLASLLPAGIDECHEALALGGGPPLATLRDLDVLGPRPPAPWRRWMEVCSPGDVALVGRYSDAHERALAALGEAAGLGRPRIALLWGNSD